MKLNVDADVHPLTRVEGHGNIRIRIADGALKEASWTVVETPRFFEAMLKGQPHEMAAFLTSRICGICSIGHTLASLRAIERAMQVKPPKDAEKLRLLAKHGETLQSHLLHIFFLVAPDFLGTSSIFPLVKSQPEVAALILELRHLANDLCGLVAGRTTHPTTLIIGGLGKAPEKAALREIRNRLGLAIPQLDRAAALFRTFVIPDFVRETEYVSLKGNGAYPWIGGELISTDGIVRPEDAYRSMTNEYKVPGTTSKYAKLSRESLSVGALARFNNNHRLLKDPARELAEHLGLKPACHNPFMNTAAQLVECLHVLLESIELIDELLDSSLDDLCANYRPRAGAATAAVEVPRGILYHYYEIDDAGLVRKADCVIPTTQNNFNIHLDLAALVEQEMKRSPGQNSDEAVRITHLCEMLVRAYDPCISCSVH